MSLVKAVKTATTPKRAATSAPETRSARQTIRPSTATGGTVPATLPLWTGVLVWNAPLEPLSGKRGVHLRRRVTGAGAAGTPGSQGIANMQQDKMQDAGAPLTLDAFLRRAIAATDGTVTRLIEEFVEPVLIEKLEEAAAGQGPQPGWDDLPAGVEVVAREVLIRGASSGRVFLHAESLIVLDHLDDLIRRELLETDKPIGKLLREYRRETFRELRGQHLEAAGPRARYFGCDVDDPVLTRVYRIFLAGKPAIQITERLLDWTAAPKGEG